MTTEEIIDYIQCALGYGCSQVCNSKNRGDCTDAEVIEAKDLAIEALQNQEILLGLLTDLGCKKIEIIDGLHVPRIICKELKPTGFCKRCTHYSNRACFLEYCKVKREEENDK